MPLTYGTITHRSTAINLGLHFERFNAPLSLIFSQKTFFIIPGTHFHHYIRFLKKRDVPYATVGTAIIFGLQLELCLGDILRYVSYML